MNADQFKEWSDKSYRDSHLKPKSSVAATSPAKHVSLPLANAHAGRVSLQSQLLPYLQPLVRDAHICVQYILL